ncbi:Hsp70 family protein [Dactylosporangium sp. AC04546]|uniref:Hsp70 family protein n=1 Tax=Dactylosporangium sp. AC04546 TaxID=2862460 RepID=UPI002E7BF681|nr:Hsp70 family protein [Dactylosporangium sp. AC04546]WVK87945.1 Hsp70 family protein [Dactylosporangium sp. AC04546]
MTGQRFRLGVDFGTSTTVGMLQRPDGRVQPLLFDGSPLLSSAVLLGLDGRLHTGRDAAHLARSAPERLEPNPKRRIDDVTVLLGDTEVAVLDLIVAVLRRVTTEATRVAGPITDIVLTHPANWGSGRRALLAEAARQVGYGGIELVGEPLAAAMYLAHARGGDLPVGACVLVYDLGAGTCDVTLLRRQPTGFAPVASDGLNDLGGLDVDAAVIAFLQATYGELWTSPAARRQLWDDVRSAKEMLSRASGTLVMVPALAKEVPLGREQLEGLTRPVLRPTIAMTRALLQQSAVPPSAVAGVFLVGGSSRIPLVATLLHEALGIAPIVAEQPELVVAEGSLYASSLPPVTQAFPAATMGPSTAAFPATSGYPAGTPSTTPFTSPLTSTFAPPSSGPPFAAPGTPSSGPPYAPPATPSSGPPFAPSSGPPYAPSSGAPFVAPPAPFSPAASPVSPSVPYSPSTQISANPGVTSPYTAGAQFPPPPVPSPPGTPAQPRPPAGPKPRRRSPAATVLAVVAVLAVLAGAAFGAVKLLGDGSDDPGGATPTSGSQSTGVQGAAGKYVMTKLPANLCEIADVAAIAAQYPTATGEPGAQRQLTTVFGYSICTITRTKNETSPTGFQSATVSFNAQVYADLGTAGTTFTTMAENARLNSEVTNVGGLGEQAVAYEQHTSTDLEKRTLTLVVTARDNNLIWTTNLTLTRADAVGWTAQEKAALRDKTIESTKATFKKAVASLA